MKRRGWVAVMLVAGGALGQGAPRVAPASRDRAISFAIVKPVMGLPVDGNRRQGLCSSDGLTYFDTSGAAGSRVLDLYTVSTAGEVKHLRRTVPFEYTSVVERDFYPGDAGLVTLIEAGKTDEPGGAPKEVQYYLATSDHDGDSSKVVALNLPFKPLKVAQFGSGEFVVLGWERANQLPQLGVLKEDGTLRRFIDFNEKGGTQESLAGAKMVPFGKDILLTYPGTTRPIKILGSTGQERTISLEFPAGYVLHDVLNSGGGYWLVARVQEMASAEAEGRKQDVVPPKERLFDFMAQDGTKYREYRFDKVPVSAVTCAANYSLEAIFEQAAGSAGAPGDGGTQLVVGTVRR